MLVYDDDSVSAQHGVGQMPCVHCQSFVAGQTLRVVLGLFIWQGLFRHVRRFNDEWDRSIAQKFRAAWRTGRKDQRHWADLSADQSLQYRFVADGERRTF